MLKKMSRPTRANGTPGTTVTAARTEEGACTMDAIILAAGLGTRLRPYTEKTAREYLHNSIWEAATGSRETWAVADRESDLMLANIAVFAMAGLDPRSGEISSWAHPDSRGRGLMTEATRLVIEHAFTTRQMRRLSLMAATGNTASNQIAINNGFSLIGTETNAEPLGDGTFADVNVYELLP